MNSEKVKEIKKGLECCKQNEIEDTCKYCLDCPVSDWDYEKECKIDLFQKTLILINELESENERLGIVIGIANERTYRKKFIDEWRKEYQKELDKQGNGHIAGYPDFDLVYKLYFEQKDRIAELEKENEKLLDSVETVQNDRCVFKCELTKKHLKQFAEMLIEKKVRLGDRFNVYDIDETLKEFIND